MLPLRYVALFAFVAVAAGQQQYSGSSAPKPTPIAILKQINRHNEDGSYTYGYEGADGSFKIETKLATGEVKGKYGYVDDTGKVRVVEYGATKYGFEPSGEGITVAPPTLVDETTNKDGTLNPEYADNYYDPEPAPQRPSALKPRPQFQLDNFPQSQYQPAQPQRSPAPAPPRAQIPGATQVEYVPQTRPQASRTFSPTPLRPAPQPQQFSFSSPAPIEEEYNEPPRPKITYAQPAQPARPAATQFRFAPEPQPQPRPAPQFAPAPQRPAQQFAPAPQRPAPQYAPAPQNPEPQYRPAPAARPALSNRGGILDQLSKDYALPQGGAAPLHDISFGYY